MEDKKLGSDLTDIEKAKASAETAAKVKETLAVEETPAETEDKKEDKKYVEEPEFKYAVIIKTNELMTDFSIEDDFEYKGVHYKLPEGAIFNLIGSLASELEKGRFHSIVSNALTQTKVKVKTPIGIKELSYPTFMAALVAEKLQEMMMKQSIAPTGIIRP